MIKMMAKKKKKKMNDEILEKLEVCGYETYLVGGYVRDELLGRRNYDIDITS